MGQGIHQRGVDRQHRVEQMSQLYSVGLGHEPEEVAVAVEAPGAPLLDDLARRDIAINAMAASLAPEDFGELLDTEGGLADLRAAPPGSLDGKIATHTGDSKWISGDKARWEVHGLRRISDAIMVGINTVIADNPQLTARDEREKPVAFRNRSQNTATINGRRASQP